MFSKNPLTFSQAIDNCLYDENSKENKEWRRFLTSIKGKENLTVASMNEIIRNNQKRKPKNKI